jgi:hypothetical protein
MDEKTTFVDGRPVTEDHAELQANGQQRDYVVLSAEERAKGFVRPVRLSYVHVGKRAPANLRELTEEERERYSEFGYVKFEPYGEDRAPVLGKFWTQVELNRVRDGCGTVTTMAREIAETYARKPTFYSGTFCAKCRRHLPVGEDGEFVWHGTSERVGT